jgi:hypothetical protein
MKKVKKDNMLKLLSYQVDGQFFPSEVNLVCDENKIHQQTSLPLEEKKE